MAVSSDYLDYVQDQLSGLGGVSSRRMFGGVGLYCDEFFFALIDDDTLYLRVNDANRADFTTRGMGQFRPYADRPELSMSYYETPADVLEDAAALVAWARRSVAAAMAAAKLAGKPAAKAAKPAAKQAAKKAAGGAGGAGTPRSRPQR
ncbi:MAG: TfoX/Sxy family protein [Gammaproteobacteria bacterium]|nr:MAG: TfoX/Sxy family protein [Gammaproteobacteria bacterium]